MAKPKFGEVIWLLYREAPASEILGAFRSSEDAMQEAATFEAGLEWIEDFGGHRKSGLWRICPIVLAGTVR